jgi:hypothetical protein
MFVQVMQGRATDAAGVKKQWDRWDQEIKPGATGYLGSTGGISPDGEFIILARFESEEAAKANSDRPEQGAWFEEASQYLEDIQFHDCTGVDISGKGGSDDAGFVQVIQGKVTDIEKARELDARMEPEMRDRRPDVIGSVTAWNPDNGRFTNAIYFTSEAEAREQEKKMESDPAFQKVMGEMMAISDGEPKFIDLPEPWLSSK